MKLLGRNDDGYIVELTNLEFYTLAQLAAADKGREWDGQTAAISVLPHDLGNILERMRLFVCGLENATTLQHRVDRLIEFVKQG